MAQIKVADAKVATHVDEYQLAFNAGGKSGIQEGDVVVLSRSVEIKDPDTGEKLGVVLLPKLRLAVNLVADAYSVARVTDRTPAKSVKIDPWGTNTTKGPLKKVTDDEFDTDNVYVQVGEAAQFRREVADEPPF
ncbi:hypothetical protein E4P39_16305 [Blastococcus sp. CT_GayMR19]|uniref:hypothetical protein n=1 Tax=Blastococcus sp. CT_GayMR19 TaxID=2559608 RepID=UPI001073E35D|nr:hypothetical protein [Blastococcus sp. CT_GayMR19]TFV72513.1 hypothetical protein E4P39_16305 [Blastococcus sp. CT_GayMR19]